MKKLLVLFISFALLLSLGLSRCNFGVAADGSYEESVAQTMVAVV